MTNGYPVFCWGNPVIFSINNTLYLQVKTITNMPHTNGNFNIKPWVNPKWKSPPPLSFSLHTHTFTISFSPSLQNMHKNEGYFTTLSQPAFFALFFVLSQYIHIEDCTNMCVCTTHIFFIIFMSCSCLYVFVMKHKSEEE